MHKTRCSVQIFTGEDFPSKLHAHSVFADINGRRRSCRAARARKRGCVIFKRIRYTHVYLPRLGRKEGVSGHIICNDIRPAG